VNIVAIIPLKINSQRCPNKNFQVLGDKLLYQWALDTILQLNIPTYIYGDTKTHKEVYSKYGPSVKYIDEGTTPKGQDGNALFKSMVKAVTTQAYNHIDYCLIFNCTAPFVKLDTYEYMLEIIHNNYSKNMPFYDSACTVNELRGRLWNVHGQAINHPPNTCPRTQEQEPILMESEACWLITPEMIITHNRRVGFIPKFVPVTPLEAVDINYPQDMEFARQCLEKE